MTRRMTDEQCEEWIAEQKRLHTTGLMTAAQIKRLECIPGWTWGTQATVKVMPAPEKAEPVKVHVKIRRPTYTVFAIQPNSYRYIDGVKVCDDFRDCGHAHRSLEAAEACLGKLAGTGSTDWINAEIRDNSGMPICDETGA